MTIRYFAAALLVLGGLPTSAYAKDAEPLVFEPSTRWIMNYADDSCALNRGFTSGDKTAWLEFRSFSVSDSFQLAIAVGGIGTSRRDPEIVFEPDQDTKTTNIPRLVIYGDEKKGYIFPSASLRLEREVDEQRQRLEDNPDQLLPDWDPALRSLRESEVQSLLVVRGFKEQVRFNFGPMDKPMEAMRTCIDELITHWGVNASEYRDYQRHATPRNMQAWAREIQRRYPSSALRQGQSGIVRARLMVDETGSPTDCILQIPSQEEAFESTSCKELMQHAEFEPAINGRGDPVASFYIASIVYVIP